MARKHSLKCGTATGLVHLPSGEESSPEGRTKSSHTLQRMGCGTQAIKNDPEGVGRCLHGGPLQGPKNSP